MTTNLDSLYMAWAQAAIADDYRRAEEIRREIEAEQAKIEAVCAQLWPGAMVEREA